MKYLHHKTVLFLSIYYSEEMVQIVQPMKQTFFNMSH